MQDQSDLLEGQVAHLEVQVEPVADPRLKIEWLHDGHPIGHTSRMKVIHEFGFVVLELSPAEPQDCGTWTCVATNNFGKAEISCNIGVSHKSLGKLLLCNNNFCDIVLYHFVFSYTLYYR